MEVKRGKRGDIGSSPPVSSWNDADCCYPGPGVRPCSKAECKRGRSDLDVVTDGSSPVGEE